MSGPFIWVTRPDGERCIVNFANVSLVRPISDGPNVGARIVWADFADFSDDVRETPEEIRALLYKAKDEDNELIYRITWALEARS